jgi:hypothetical protein
MHCNDDIAWFAARPTRSFRLRPLLPSESAKDSSVGQSHALIRQLYPGFRVKWFVSKMDMSGTELDSVPDVDSEIEMLFRQIPDTDQVLMAASVIDALRNEPSGLVGGLQ